LTELAKKRDIETEDLIKDLRKRVQDLTKANSKLNSKVIRALFNNKLKIIK